MVKILQMPDSVYSIACNEHLFGIASGTSVYVHAWAPQLGDFNLECLVLLRATGSCHLRRRVALLTEQLDKPSGCNYTLLRYSEVGITVHDSPLMAKM